MIYKQQIEKIKVLSFDGDMTLWDFHSVMRQALYYTLFELRSIFPGPETAQLDIEKMIEIRNRTAEELKGKVINLEEIRFQSFRRTLKHVGVENVDVAEHINFLYLKHRFEDIELYPDVHPTLSILNQFYKIGLCSNGNSYPEYCGLSDTFAFTVFAQDVGAEKPAERIFIEVCRQARCTPDEMMHIGDSLTADVYGAQHVGAVTVWLNRNCSPLDANIHPDFQIQALTELIDILGIPQ